jgi:hypothetical protein
MLNNRKRASAYTMPAPNRPRTKPTALGPDAPHQPVRSPGLELRNKLTKAYAKPETKPAKK